MENTVTFPEKLLDVIKKEGVVAIISWGDGEPHVVNTWNSFLVLTDDGRILIPAAGMRKTQANTEIQSKVKLSVGSKEVVGFKDYPGTGFIIEGTAQFITSGTEYDSMKEKFPFLSRVLAVTATSVKQKI